MHTHDTVIAEDKMERGGGGQSFSLNQGIGIKGREMTLVWHEKASRTALQTSSVLHTHTLLVQTHNMTTVKEIFLEYL